MATLLSLLVLLSAILPGAQALTIEDQAIIAPGGHLVLMNFTVERAYPEDSPGSVQYLISLDGASAQDRFDVLLLTQAQYLNYASGLPFDHVPGLSTINAGDYPAIAFDLVNGTGDYTLLVDNSDRAGTPSAAAELVVKYQVTAQNVEVQKESRWDLFIALMIVIVIVGAAFLIVLSMYMRHRYQRVVEDLERKCSNCGKMMVPSGDYCPYCGEKR